MAQKDMIQKLKDNPQQAKQFNEVLKTINEAVKAEMPVFLKLVQFDTMKELQKKAAQDKVGDKASPEAQLTESLDAIMKQIGQDLEKQIIAKFESLK